MHFVYTNDLLVIFLSFNSDSGFHFALIEGNNKTFTKNVFCKENCDFDGKIINYILFVSNKDLFKNVII